MTNNEFVVKAQHFQNDVWCSEKNEMFIKFTHV